MKFRIINKSDSKIISSGDIGKVAFYLSSRNLSNFMVIKSDDRGDRLVNFHNAKDFTELKDAFSRA